MLNILPEIKKRQLAQEANHRLIRSSALVIGIAFILLDAMLLSVRYGLNWWSRQLTNTPASITISEENQAAVIQQLDRLNNTLKAIQDLGAERNPLPVAVLPLRNVPKGISIASARTNFLTGEVTVDGVAADRETLLTLQNLYRSYTEYEQMNFPITSLTVREQIPFSASAIVVNDYRIIQE